MVSESDDLTAMDYGDMAPTVEVIVYRHGEVVHRELCESAEAAAVDQWSELDGVECSVDDLAVHHVGGQILEPDPDEPFDETAYPPSPRENERRAQIQKSHW
jgi:hypothetical protein